MATPNHSALRTGWVCIATQGASVDGRQVTRAWLEEMADSYDPDFYTAVIWPEHDRWMNFGHIRALKTEEVEGKLKLFAILKPNRAYIDYNRDGQCQFGSIEPEENFAGTGKTYLMGLGVTDRPASTGTTRLQFQRPPHTERLRGDWEAMPALATWPAQDGDAAQADPKALGLLRTLFSYLARHGEATPPTPTHDEPTSDDTMTDEQLNKILTPITTLGEQQAALMERITALEQAGAPDAVTPAEQPAEAAASEPVDAAIAQRFSQLDQAIEKMANQMNAVDQTLTQFAAETPGQRPGLGGQSKPRVF